MYILTRSIDGKRIVGDFISPDQLSKYPTCAYYDWKKQEIIYIGKFTKKQKKEITKRLEINKL